MGMGGSLQEAQGRVEEALDFFGRALSIREKALRGLFRIETLLTDDLRSWGQVTSTLP